MDSYTDSPIEFIKLLKSEHKEIITTVYEVDQQPGGSNDYKSSIEKLNKITDILFDHLEKEDKKLYPVLLGSKETNTLAKKYSYDMERLSCIALDFFKRYCVNREGLKIFVEDFINAYSIFKGLLKVRIHREELELYPAFILLRSGVINSEVVSYLQEQETRLEASKKTIFVFGQNEAGLKALSLVLEMNGYKVESTTSLNRVSNLIKELHSDLILLDVSKGSKEISDLIISLRENYRQDIQLVGYSTTDHNPYVDKPNIRLDGFIPKATYDVEEFSARVRQLLNS